MLDEWRFSAASSMRGSLDSGRKPGPLVEPAAVNDESSIPYRMNRAPLGLRRVLIGRARRYRHNLARVTCLTIQEPTSIDTRPPSGEPRRSRPLVGASRQGFNVDLAGGRFANQLHSVAPQREMKLRGAAEGAFFVRAQNVRRRACA
jgi:hypothetical protein